MLCNPILCIIRSQNFTMIMSEQPSQSRLEHWCSKMSYGHRSDLGTFVPYSEKRLETNPKH